MRRLLVALLLTGCAATTTPPVSAPQPPANPAIAQELVAMLKEDQEVRQRWIRDQQNETIREEVRALGKKHTARLDEIVAAHGWPGKTIMGDGQQAAAWTIAQHGDHAFLEHMLPLMYEAVVKRELEEGLYASMDPIADYTKELCEMYLQK